MIFLVFVDFLTIYISLHSECAMTKPFYDQLFRFKVLAVMITHICHVSKLLDLHVSASSSGLLKQHEQCLYLNYSILNRHVRFLLQISEMGF